MDITYNILMIGVPAVAGLLGWIALRQRNTPPLVAGCSALLIALVAMTVIFALIFLM